MHQGGFLGGDAHRAQPGIAGIAASHLVAHAAGHLQNQLAGEDAVSAETDHLERIGSEIPGLAEAAGRPQRNLTLPSLGHCGEVARITSYNVCYTKLLRPGNTDRRPGR